MTKELHPVTELLLARMKSHPEEFEYGVGRDVVPATRWYTAICTIVEHGTEADKAAVQSKLNSMRMDEAHQWALDELLNGDERRRKRREEEHKYIKMQQQTAQMQAAQLYNNQYANGQNYLRYQPGPDAYEFTEQGLTTTYTRETLEDNPGIVASIKKALGL